MSVASSRPTAAAPVPAHALRRGTRGFAAVVLFLSALIVLTIAIVTLPASAADPTLLTILVPASIVFGIAHLVAAYGSLRRRRWAAPLTLYLAAIGLGLVAFTLLLIRGGIDPFAPAAATAAAAPSLNGVVGLAVWLAGSWLVAARFVVRGMAAPERRREEPAADPSRVMAAHPLVVAADAARPRRRLEPRSA